MKPPVFVVGCPRSGNHLVYDSLLSSGAFAVYENHTHVFSILAPKFGDLRVLKHRQKLMDAWLKGWLFKYTQVDAKLIRGRILKECRSAGDFLRIVMEEICRNQGVDRWAENTPDHVFYLREIKMAYPDALIIHVIRDGRDAALSLDKAGWIPPLPWDKSRRRLVAALFWQWAVETARSFSREAGSDYIEVRFEDMVVRPRETLAKIGAFIHEDLDYDSIQREAVGAIRKPNTVFQAGPGESSPIGRWEKMLTAGELFEIESQAGPLLRELGYSLASKESHSAGVYLRNIGSVYRSVFETKLWLKSRTPLGRFIRAGLIRGDTDLPLTRSES